jgi:N-ethylmaleimide reductase
MDLTQTVEAERRATLMAPVQLGELALRNRVVMAPMTRSRALPDGCAHASAATYYAQRATAGMIITEGVCICAEGVGNPNVPGIWSRDQIESWRPVTDAVHELGGTIVLQLWHTGRASDPSLQPGGRQQVAPSAVGIRGKTYTSRGWVEFSPPRALERSEIRAIVETYAAAAVNARKAGFDGVEIHGANGYLIDQFLHAGSNHRTDGYGGSPQRRARFMHEVVGAVVDACGAGRVGLRISPSSSFYGMEDPEPEAIYEAALGGLPVGLAYVHVVEPGISGSTTVVRAADALDSGWVRARWSGGLIGAGDYTAPSAVEALASGRVDAVAFGRLFVANPDLPRRLVEATELNVPRRETFYGGGDEGYLDYPALSG